MYLNKLLRALLTQMFSWDLGGFQMAWYMVQSCLQKGKAGFTLLCSATYFLLVKKKYCYLFCRRNVLVWDSRVLPLTWNIIQWVIVINLILSLELFISMHSCRRQAQYVE